MHWAGPGVSKTTTKLLAFAGVTSLRDAKMRAHACVGLLSAEQAVMDMSVGDMASSGAHSVLLLLLSKARSKNGRRTSSPNASRSVCVIPEAGSLKSTSAGFGIAPKSTHHC